MTIGSMRRRISSLEEDMPALIPYPPITRGEVEDIAGRVRDGMPLSRAEKERLIQHSPIVQGEYLINAIQGRIFFKHYVSVDSSEI
jgi:hypothetical protein